MTETRHATLIREGATIRVSLTRAAKLNALSEQILHVLSDAVEQLAKDSDARVLLIDAEGDYFSAGMDIFEMPDFRGMPPSEFRHRYRRRHQDLWDEFERTEKPIVVAHQGPCLGGALEMSLSCDFRIASDQAAYGLPEIRLGALPASGGISRLTRLVGPAWARWIALAGRQVDARTALSIGLVHQVVDAIELPDYSRAFAADLAALPAEAVAAAKLTIDAIDPVNRGVARDIERLACSQLATDTHYHSQLSKFRDSHRSDAGANGERDA